MRFLRLLLVLLVWPVSVFAQEDDRGYIQGLLEDALSTDGRGVRIEGFAGALSSRATIDRITVEDEGGVWLTVTDVAMTWTRRALLRGAIEIDEITVGRIEMPRLPIAAEEDAPPAPEARSPFALPELPVSLRLADLNLNEVVLGAEVATEDMILRVAGNAELAGGEGSADLQVERLDRGGALQLSGAYSNSTRNLRLETSFNEPAGGVAARLLSLPGTPSVELSLTGEGTIDDFSADLRLTTDGAERLAGQIVLRADGDAETQRVSLDVGGDIAPIVAPDYREFLGRDIRLRAEALQRADGSIELQDLDLRAQALALTGTAAIAGDGWPQRLALSGRIVPPGGDEVLLPVPGAATFLRGATLSGTFDATQGNEWQLTLDAQGLRTDAGAADRLALEGSGVIDRASSRVTGTIELTGDGLVPVDPALEQALGGALRGGLSFDWEPGAPFFLRDLDLAGPDYGLTGDITFSDADTLNPKITPDLRLSADDLSRFAPLSGIALDGAAQISVMGEVTPVTGGFDLMLDGTTRDLATGIAQVDPLIAGVGSLQLEAVRDEAGLRAERLLLVTPEARIEGNGTLASEASSGRMEARIRETALVLPELSGPTSLTVTAEQSGSVWSLDAQGNVAEAGRLSYVGTVDLGLDVPVVAGRLDARLTRLSALSGLAGRPMSGSVDISVTGEGAVDGEAFSLSAEGSLQDVALGLTQIDPLLRGRTGLSLSAARTSGGAITLDPVELTGVVNGRFTGQVMPDGPGGPQVDGQISLQTASLSPLSGLAGLPLRGAAQIEAQASGGVLDGPLTLEATVRGQGLGIGTPMVDSLLRGNARLDVNVAREESGAYRIDDLTLDASGIDAEVSGRYGPNNAAAFDLDVRLANLGTMVPDLPGAARVTGTARQSGGPWQLSLEGTGPAGIGVSVNGSAAADFGTLNLAVNGSAPLALANGRIAPQVLSGIVNFNLSVNGPPGLGAVSGTVSTDGARFSAPAQNIVLNDLGGEVRLSGGRAQISFSGALASGGSVTLTGPVTLSPPFVGDLAVQLRDAVLRQAGVFETTANGQVNVNGPLTGGARIGGLIDLGTVEARIPDIGASYSALDGLRHVGMPRDVQLTLKFAGMDKTETGGAAPLPAFPLDLTVRAENRIFVRGRGLDAELGGSLRLTGTSANVVPAGQFDLIRGRLDLLGRRLDLTEGLVALRGSFDPVIRFVATTRVEDTEITITIEGPTSSPELTVGSVPDLPQDEALSFFLFGRSVTEISALQAVQLAAAIRTLSGRGGLGLTESLRGGLGVSDLDIGTAEDGTAQARVGAYLTENIYSDVTVDAKGQSEINLNLTVNENVTVRGRLGSDGDSGIGVFFERDY